MVRGDLRLSERLSEPPSYEVIRAILGASTDTVLRLLCFPRTFLQVNSEVGDPTTILPSVWRAILKRAAPCERILQWGRETIERLMREGAGLSGRAIVALASLYRAWCSVTPLDGDSIVRLSALIEAATTRVPEMPSVSRLLPLWLRGCLERYFGDLWGPPSSASTPHGLCVDGSPVSQHAYVMLFSVVRVRIPAFASARDSSVVVRTVARIRRALELDAASRTCVHVRRTAMPPDHMPLDRGVDAPPMAAICVLACVARDVCGYDGGDEPRTRWGVMRESAPPSRVAGDHARAFEWARAAHAALRGEAGALRTCERWCAEVLDARGEDLLVAIHQLWIHLVCEHPVMAATQSLVDPLWMQEALCVLHAPCGHPFSCACAPCERMRCALAGSTRRGVAPGYEHPIAPWTALLRDLQDNNPAEFNARVPIDSKHAIRAILDTVHLVRVPGYELDSIPVARRFYALAQLNTHAAVQLVGALGDVNRDDIARVHAWVRLYFGGEDGSPGVRALREHSSAIFRRLARAALEWQRIFSVPLPGDIVEAQVSALHHRYARMGALLPRGLASLARPPWGADLVWWCGNNPTSDHAIGRMLVPLPPAADVPMRRAEATVCATVARSLEGSTQTVLVEPESLLPLCSVCVAERAPDGLRASHPELPPQPALYTETRLLSCSAVGRVVVIAGRHVTLCAAPSCGAMMEMSFTRSVFVDSRGWVCTACVAALRHPPRRASASTSRRVRSAAKQTGERLSTDEGSEEPFIPHDEEEPGTRTSDEEDGGRAAARGK